MKRVVAVLFLVMLAFGGAIRTARAQGKVDPRILARQTKVDPRILAYDKGPAKIDVSKYTPEMQKKYTLFTKVCSQCHTIARPINSEFAIEEEWERYVKRMMRKAGDELISPEDGKQIIAFLTYDAQIRKKALFDKKTAEAANAPR
jgi:hypothetical protein